MWQSRRVGQGALVALLWGVALVSACRVDEPSAPPLPPIHTPLPLPDAASIPRVVVDAGMGVPRGDGGAPDVARDGQSAPTDAARLDARPADVRPPDGGRDAASDGPQSCGLIRQDCPTKGQGCYPSDQRVLTCFAAGSIGELGPCVTHDQCLPGYLCLGREGGQYLCMRACHTDESACPGGVPCQAIPALPPYGYCAP